MPGTEEPRGASEEVPIQERWLEDEQSQIRVTKEPASGKPE